MTRESGGSGRGSGRGQRQGKDERKDKKRHEKVRARTMTTPMITHENYGIKTNKRPSRAGCFGVARNVESTVPIQRAEPLKYKPINQPTTYRAMESHRASHTVAGTFFRILEPFSAPIICLGLCIAQPPLLTSHPNETVTNSAPTLRFICEKSSR